MKKHINSIIISVILALAFALFGCNSSINNPEKDKKQNTNTTTNNPATNNPDNPELELELSEMPLTFQAITAGKIILSGKDSFERISIQKGDGLIFDSSDIITVQPGDLIYFYGKKKTDTTSITINLTIECTADFYVYGNVMSLLYYTDFKDKTEIKTKNAFQSLFKNNTHIKNHETLDIVLPATDLSDGCYKQMFYGCTGLTRAPELPATTLTTECYDSMFLNCKNLKNIKCFATDISAVDCTRNWIYQVADTGTFTSAQTNSIWRYKDKYSGIPVDWTADPPFAVVNAKELPLTLEAIEDGFIQINNINQFGNVKYKKNNGEITQAGSQIDISAGDIVCLYADGPVNESSDYKTRMGINCTDYCYIYGNIMSLLYSETFSDKTDLKNKTYTFYYLFANNTHIKNCSIDLVLPATSLTEHCYYMMFQLCSELTIAPELPATTLASYCYDSMFVGTSFVSAPKLPAKNLASYCYQSMFQGCQNLTTAPELPATTLKMYCYASMFNNCQGLTTAPELPAGKNGEGALAIYCYQKMFGTCKSLTSAPELPATTLERNCYAYMFMDCTNLTSVPELPATSLADSCYVCMFANCKNLTSAPELPAGKNNIGALAPSCYASMFKGCTSLTTAPELPAKTLISACYFNMFTDCTNLNTLYCSATDISATNCIKDWLPAKDTSIGFVFTDKPDIFTSLPDNGWMTEKELPLTLEAIKDGTITIENPGNFTNLKYSKNYGSKQSYSSDGISVLAGDTVFFFADASTNTYTSGMTINCTADCYVYGNIMSLVTASANKYSINETLTATSSFLKLFYENKYIKNHPEKKLKLPATTLTSSCYVNMFTKCYGLTEAPILPATSLANSCYEYMFANCTSLQEAPDLPAPILQGNCYLGMFSGCTKLTKAPVISATTAGVWSCGSMFSGCTSLVNPPALNASKLGGNCYNSMFNNCTSLQTAPALPATTLQASCYKQMFKGCTSLKTAPELKATTLADNCYESMFSGCAKLNNVKCLATNISATDCTKDWLKDVAVNGTFTKKSTTGWTTGSTSGIPSGWTVQNATN